MSSNRSDGRHSSFQTICLHGGDGRQRSSHVATPIYLSTSFEFPDTEVGAERAGDVAADEFYGRWGSINARELEAIVAALEGADDAVCASSGLAIISMVLHSFLEAGDRFVGSKACYSETLILQRELCGQLGVDVQFVDGTSVDELAAAIGPKTKIVYLETPANPVLDISDIASVVTAARDRSDALVVVDSTFATPFNQSPLELGADIVLHSATKYIGGHSDVVAGVAAARQELADTIRKCFSFHGPHLDPFAAWLLCRGLRTLGLRMERHNSNALRLARFLEGRPEVSRVAYPFLSSHPQHELAMRQMRGGGGMVCFEVGGGRRAAVELLEALQTIKMAVSLGSADSLLTHPASMTHNLLSDAELEAAGISAGMMRFSVGLEDAGDLEADLARAFEAIGGSRASAPASNLAA
jgi:methionine-gamma-lyase